MANEFKTAVYWFRRDLRVVDNTALHHAAKAAGSVVPVYVLSRWKKRHLWTGSGRQSFLCGALESLGNNLESLGGRLIFRQGSADVEIVKLIKESGADALFFNRGVDPFGIEMERKVSEACRQLGVTVRSFKDVVVHEKDEVLTGAGTPYRVFTPYSKAWLKMPKPPSLAKPHRLVTPEDLASLPPPQLETWGLKPDGKDVLEPGERAARRRLTTALAKTIPTYAARRNTPAGTTTSRLSQDLRFGLLSPREVLQRCQKLSLEADDRTVSDSVACFINELIWREFAMQVLGHFPGVLETEFNPGWRGIPWDDDEDRFQLWAGGRTGFPIVDAGMRQLQATGFMHNRVRMIVAMFLTKDLHLHWMKGESFFMQHLIDGEVASNNGGWQWSAGTGADAAPYFRIQNPWSQTKSYDPDGAYIKEWVPELAATDPKHFLKPPADGSPIADGYPLPMVDHSVERQVTLDRFNKHKSNR